MSPLRTPLCSDMFLPKLLPTPQPRMCMCTASVYARVCAYARTLLHACACTLRARVSALCCVCLFSLLAENAAEARGAVHGLAECWPSATRAKCETFARRRVECTTSTRRARPRGVQDILPVARRREGNIPRHGICRLRRRSPCEAHGVHTAMREEHIILPTAHELSAAPWC